MMAYTTDRDGDGAPLLPMQREPEFVTFQELRQRQRARIYQATVTEADEWLLEKGYDDDEEDGDYLLKGSAKQKRRTVLVFHDALFLVLDFLQYYALLMSLAIRWPWPYDWLISTRFAFAFNIDIWELTKMFTPGVFDSSRDGFIASNLIRIDYRLYLLVWCSCIVVATVVYIGLYISMNYQKRYNLLMQIARLQRIYIILCQVFAIPIGVALGKVFHCNLEGNMDVHNSIPCNGAEHLAYMAVGVVIVLFLYIMLPIWMIGKIHLQIFSLKTERHEGHLQLKEAEYGHGLDTIWYLKLYHLFSSFNLFWVYYRPVTFFLKFLIIFAYSALMSYPMYQMIVILAPLVVLILLYMIKRPFRVASFNLQLLVTYLCMILLAFMGLMQNSALSSTVFFQTAYLFSELLAINLFWVLFTVAWVIYICLRNFGILCKRNTLWPQMTNRGLDKLADDTRRYMHAILRGRIVLEKSLSMSPLFSPAHEVARQIQIINAYCREAEYLGDSIHETLWDLLDELIEAHSRIAPTSLFGTSMKSSIGETAKELLKVLPDFKKRLAQREYDFVLMTPVKRRILLKMYAIGVFMNGSKMEKTKPATDPTDTVHKLYNPMESVVLKHRTIEGDDGFYEDVDEVSLEMGPTAYRQRKAVRPQQNMLVIMEDGEQEEEEGEHKEEEPAWMRAESRISDISSLLLDREMDDIDEMMMGIPSRQNSLQSVGSTRHRPPSSMSRLSHHSRPSSRNSIVEEGSSLRTSRTPSPIQEDEEKESMT